MQCVILYRSRCVDALTATWSIWKKFADASFRESPADAPCPVVPDGKDVVVLGLNFRRKELEHLYAECKSLSVFDHREALRCELMVTDGKPLVQAFDRKRSTAAQAWNHFHPDVRVPLLVKYSMDHALKLYKLPFSHEIEAFIASYEMSLSVWDELAKRFQFAEEDNGRLESYDPVVKEGTAILRYRCRPLRPTSYEETEKRVATLTSHVVKLRDALEMKGAPEAGPDCNFCREHTNQGYNCSTCGCKCHDVRILYIENQRKKVLEETIL